MQAQQGQAQMLVAHQQQCAQMMAQQQGSKPQSKLRAEARATSSGYRFRINEGRQRAQIRLPVKERIVEAHALEEMKKQCVRPQKMHVDADDVYEKALKEQLEMVHKKKGADIKADLLEERRQWILDYRQDPTQGNKFPAEFDEFYNRFDKEQGLDVLGMGDDDQSLCSGDAIETEATRSESASQQYQTSDSGYSTSSGFDSESKAVLSQMRCGSAASECSWTGQEAMMTERSMPTSGHHQHHLNTSTQLTEADGPSSCRLMACVLARADAEAPEFGAVTPFPLGGCFDWLKEPPARMPMCLPHVDLENEIFGVKEQDFTPQVPQAQETAMPDYMPVGRKRSSSELEEDLSKAHEEICGLRLQRDTLLSLLKRRKM